MHISIKKLTPTNSNDFLHYFDYDAFSDHEEWAGCYCLESHLSKEENDALWGKKNKRRKKAKKLIQEGVMTGYLIYNGSDVIGWCNAGDKANYYPISNNDDFHTNNAEKNKIKIIYCIDIAPAHRGKGLANLIVEKVLADAKEEGYSYVEAYPFTDKNMAYQYKGPVRLYEKYGFEIYRELECFYIMRKVL
ncbi:MAG: GNAT family N-acetyltransferase [Oscillospiraceae bacterium]|nr:GNAT family N-acetyltransferase [Oscillospiraceae bacterium]